MFSEQKLTSYLKINYCQLNKSSENFMKEIKNIINSLKIYERIITIIACLIK